MVVSDASGKPFHGWLSLHLTPYFNDFSRDTQMGGKAKMGTDFCTLNATMMWQLARHSDLFGAQLFLDVISAVDVIITELVMNRRTDDESVARILKELEYSPEIMHELAGHLASDTAFKHANVPTHLASLLCEVHTDTWHTTQGLDSVSKTDLGSKPGDPPGGDICIL